MKDKLAGGPCSSPESVGVTGDRYVEALYFLGLN